MLRENKERKNKVEEKGEWNNDEHTQGKDNDIYREYRDYKGLNHAQENLLSLNN